MHSVIPQWEPPNKTWSRQSQVIILYFFCTIFGKCLYLVYVPVKFWGVLLGMLLTCIFLHKRLWKKKLYRHTWNGIALQKLHAYSKIMTYDILNPIGKVILNYSSWHLSLHSTKSQKLPHYLVEGKCELDKSFLDQSCRLNLREGVAQWTFQSNRLG